MDISTDVFKMLLAASPEWVTAIICIVVGYLIRPFPAIPNRLIPPICVLVGAIAYSFIKPRGDLSPDLANPVVLRVIFGMIIGFVTWTFHKAAIKPLESKFPWLKNFLDTGADEAQSQPVNDPKAP